MSEKMKENYKITFIRGATTASGNSVREIFGGNKTCAIILIQKSTSLDTCICWQSKKATESSPLNFLAIEAGKHAFKSFVAVNVMDNMFVLIRLLRVINSSINSTTATSISLTEFPDAVVAPRINVIL